MVMEVFSTRLGEPAGQNRIPKIEFRAAGKHFGNLEAISPFSLSIRRGEFVALLGPSGCGKSTLLSILAGIDRPTTGELIVDGRAVTGPDRSRALVFQQDGLLPWRTVEKNAALGLEYAKVQSGERKESVRRILEAVGLTDFAGYYPHQLSGGMRQRVSLARSFVMNPDILLLDEPFGSLDAITRMKMHYDLQRLWEGSGKTVVMVTHDVDEALYLADRVIILSPRPARIVSDMNVPFPRPRDRSFAGYDEFRNSLLCNLGLE